MTCEGLIRKAFFLGIIVVIVVVLLLYPTPTWFLNDAKEALGIVQTGESQRHSLFADQLYVGQVLKKTDDDCLISVPEMAQTINGKKELTHILSVDDCDFNENDFVEVVFGGTLVQEEDSGKPDTETNPKFTDVIRRGFSNPFSFFNPGSNPNIEITVNPLPESSAAENISFTTWREGDDVFFRFDDESLKTTGGTFILKNSNGTLLSGEFTSPTIQCSLGTEDAIPQIIEMTIEHEDLGTVSSSALNPADNTGEKVTGIFTSP